MKYKLTLTCLDNNQSEEIDFAKALERRTSAMLLRLIAKAMDNLKDKPRYECPDTVEN